MELDASMSDEQRTTKLATTVMCIKRLLAQDMNLSYYFVSASLRTLTLFHRIPLPTWLTLLYCLHNPSWLTLQEDFLGQLGVTKLWTALLLLPNILKT